MNTFMNILSLETLVYLTNVAIASFVACGTALIAIRIYRKAPLPLSHAMLVVSLIATLAGPFFLALPHSSFSPFAFTTHSNVVQSRELAPSSSNEHWQPIAEFGDRSGTAVRGTPSATPANVAKTAGIAAPVVRSIVPLPNISAVPSRWSWPNVIGPLGSSLALIWLIGFAWASCQLARGFIQLRRLIKSLKPLASSEIEMAAREAARQLGPNHAPTIRQSDLIHGPLSIGLFRPLIVVPTGSTRSLTPNQLHGMLLHEIAHIIRRDHLIGVLQRLAVTLFWWNPLVHRVSQRISTTREQICDDLATTRIESPDSYADMLVELAGRVGHLSLPAAIGIFESSGREFTDRVTRLLNPSRPIVTSLDRWMKFTSGAALILILGAILGTGLQVKSADASGAPGNDLFDAPVQPLVSKPDNASPTSSTPKSKDEAPNAKSAPPIKWHSLLRGTIKSPDGKPLASAHVRVDVRKIHQYPTGHWEETIHAATITTGANGEYRFDTSKLPEMTHRPFCIYISCTADGYADAKTWTWYDDKDKSVGEHFRDVKMKSGRVVRGRCVDRNGNPVAGALVKVASDHGPDNWAWDPRETDSNGTFEISVPASSKLAYELWVAHPKWAPQHAAIPKEGNELADIRLQEGARVKGSVLKANGKPATGVVVEAESVFGGNLKSVGFPMKVAVKTDSNGDYELPPLAGIFKVSLRQAAETDGRLNDRFVVADGPPPPVLPQKISASGTESQTLDFHGGPTLTVRGTVRWADGRPVPGTEAWASYLPDNGISTELGRTHTDDQGNYSFELPRPIDSLYITGIGAFDKSHKWCYAYGDTKVPVHQQGVQFIQLNELKGDLDGLNFVVRPEKPEDPVKATPDRS
jgi:beta-lactamase regulating signal transducer with metallopeptidase domain/protocatechuate 3,4-dioxygenase beta subunit